MRYGLLLKALHDNTADSHKDKHNLAAAILKVTHVALPGIQHEIYVGCELEILGYIFPNGHLTNIAFKLE